MDGHEYNVGAIGTCPTGGFQSITLRAPLPKTDVTAVSYTHLTLPTSDLV